MIRQAFTWFPVLALLALLAGPPAFAANDKPWENKLPFQNATISYDITGMETGKEVLYIKDHGLYRARHHDGTTSMFGMAKQTLTLEITDPDWIYTFDLNDKSGTKITNPNKYYQEEYEKLSAEEKENVQKNAEELGISMVKDLQGQLVPNAVEILGYSCDRTTIMGMTVEVIHQTDVPLRSEMNIMGMRAKIVATSIDTGAPPADAFELPADITPVHDPRADEMARQMAASSINTLKDPDGAEKMRAKMQDDTQGGQGGFFGQMEEAEREQEDYPEEEPQQGGMDDSVQQGLNMLKGLFGN